MADALADVVFYRGVERWLIVLGGLLLAYFGYKLFLYGVDQGHGKLKTESAFFKLTFSGSGPGLFFMAFGALILMSGVYSTATRTRDHVAGTPAQVSGSTSGGAPVVTHETVKFTGGDKAACDTIRLQRGDDGVEKALYAYKHVGHTRAGTQVKALAEALEKVTNKETQRSILLAVEEVVCTLEH